MKKIVVIGGGILGSSTAYHLAKNGASVTLIDDNHHGKATQAAAGIVCPWLSKRRNQKWYRLVKQGAAYYPDLIKQLAALGQKQTGYKQTGALWLHQDSKELAAAYERARQKQADAPEMGELTVLSPSETQTLFPPLSNDFGAVHVSGAARVDGSSLNKALQQAAQNLGATLIPAKATLVRESPRRLSVYADGKRVQGDEMVVACGAWAKELLAPVGIAVDVREQKAQIIHLHLETNTDEWPVVMPPGNSYLLAFENGRIVAGTTHEDYPRFNTAVTAGGMHTILANALNVAPGLQKAEWLETRVGFRPVVPHFQPVFGLLPGVEDVWFANGLGSSGLTTGPYIGMLLAQQMLGNRMSLDPEDYKVATILQDNR
ncbi:FAD-binding oxidoreductase [Bacillus sp. FSL W7-1282]